ncbi:hypothetical protein KJ564_04090 [bacterium]|nr:hypothetical protein [bacterium]MBU1881074.1 hypothetical protein [bacterium]
MLLQPSKPFRSAHFFVFAASLFIFLNLVLYISIYPLTGEEDRRCIVAQEMLLSGDYFHPTVFNVPYYKKPPMHNWLIVLPNLLDGVVDRVSARLVSIIALLLTGWSLYLFLLKKHADKALIGFLAVTTNYLMLCEYGNLAETDIIITLFTSLSFIIYLSNPLQIRSVFISSLFMGAGLLTKGLSPLYFYPAVLLVACFTQQNRLRKLSLIGLHFLMSLLLPAVWLWLYSLEGSLSDLLRIFTAEVSEKSTGSVGAFLWHLIYFPGKIFIVLLPWSLILAFAFKRRIVKDEIYWSSLLMFLISLAIFTVSPESRDRYLMPAFPAFAILCSYHIDAKIVIRKSLQRMVFSILAILAAGCAVFGAIEGYFLQAAVFIVLALVIGLLLPRPLRLTHFASVLAAFMLVTYMQGLFFYRAQIRFDHQPGAREIAAHITEPLPVVAHHRVSNRTGLFLQAELQRPVFKTPRENFSEYYYLSYPAGVDSSAENFLTVPYPEDHNRDLILQLKEINCLNNSKITP